MQDEKVLMHKIGISGSDLLGFTSFGWQVNKN